jgi:hypothetical protein
MCGGINRRLLKILLVIFLLCPTFISTVNAQSNKGLVSSYTFDEGNLHDLQGRNNAKGEDVVPVEDRFGNPSAAYFLHGTYTSYISLGINESLKPTAGSICLWVRIDKPVYKGTGYYVNPIILAKCHNGDNFFEGYFIGYDLFLKKITVNTDVVLKDTIQVAMSSSKIISTGEWHHLVLAYDDDFLWLYIDGVLQNNEKAMRKAFRSCFLQGDSVMIGNTANAKNNRFLCGAVDDIYIYNRVLNQDEVLELVKAKDPNRTRYYVRWLYWFLCFVTISFAFVWLLLRRSKKELKKQKEKNRLSAKMNELETRAIRSQMNPHFIFNALNTLQRFILEDNKKNAQTYLVEFSNLLRRLLESSDADSITLNEEIEILNSYLDIEKLRFDNSFEYEVSCEINNSDRLQIPFMLVQPFVENAIWHGLQKKKGERKLKVIFFKLDDRCILCTVDDNGVGRQGNEKEKNPIRKRSLATDFIKQRLEILEKVTGVNCRFEIRDKRDKNNNNLGTVVTVTIPILTK